MQFVSSVTSSLISEVEVSVDIVTAVECTFILLCRKLYEETEHDEVGKYVCSQTTISVDIIFDQDQVGRR